MKQDWKVKKLGDVCNVIGGGTPSKSNNKFYNGDIYWATVRDMKGEIISNTEHKITKDAVKNSSTNIIPKGNVVIATRVGLGKVCLIENDTAINQDLRGVIPIDTKALSINFLFRWFKLISEKIVEEGTGATVQGVKLDFIKSLLIPLPPLSEQQRIVAILDEAFAAIAQAKENAEKNLQNARELFDSYLQSVFANLGDGWEEKTLGEIGITQTGTTPKTSDKENYGDFVSFIKPADIDITGNGEIRYDNKGLSEKGLRTGRKMLNGSILMVCIGASIGKVGFVDRDVSCNQQINSLTVNKGLDSKFFYYALTTKDFFEQVIKNSAQATLPIINKGKWEKLSVSYPKSISEQQEIVSKFETLSAETKKLENIYRQKINDLDELKKSILQKAFNGELTASNRVSNVIEFPLRILNISTTDLQAGIVAIAHQRHQEKGKVLTFGHVKAEKIVHLAESVLGVELDRFPVKDAAGPNDFPHLKKVESRAEKAGFFYTNKQGYGGYSYTPGSQFDNLIEKTKTALNDKTAKLINLIDLLVPMNTQEAELVATVYAAWNNLLIDNLTINDEAIVYEARENWHIDKLNIQRERFFKTIDWMKQNNLVPNGKGKKVLSKK